MVAKAQKDGIVEPKYGVPAERSRIPPKTDEKGNVKIVGRVGQTGNKRQAILAGNAHNRTKQRRIYRLVFLTKKLILGCYPTSRGKLDRLPEKKLEFIVGEQRVE